MGAIHVGCDEPPDVLRAGIRRSAASLLRARLTGLVTVPTGAPQILAAS